MLSNLFYILNLIFENHYFLIIAIATAIIIKVYLLCSLALCGLRSQTTQKPLFFLIFVLLGSVIEDFAWILKFSQLLIFHEMDYRIIIFFARFAWAFDLIQYQSLAFFIESLIEKKFELNLRRKFFLILNGFLCCTFLYLAFFKSYSTVDITARPKFEFYLFKFTGMYTFLLIFPILITCLFKLRYSKIPKILKKQFKVLIFGFCPRIISDFIQSYKFALPYPYIPTNSSIICVSTLIFAYAIFYCTKKVMRLRFLNLKSFVQSKKKYNFINKFTHVLEQLSLSTNTHELTHITKNFFNDSQQISINRTKLYIRKLDSNILNENDKINLQNNLEKYQTTEEIVESFIGYDSSIYEFLKQSKILIYDDIDFSNFYVDSKEIKNSLLFLNQINADIFIPIYKKHVIIAYIIIEQDKKSNKLYSNIERDEMVVFSSYLANVIDLLQNRSLETLIANEKELKDELYLKHQEINQYKECIRSFLKKNQQRKIGILFYKNRKFIFGNQDAKELIPININILEGHSLTQSLKKVAKQVEDYKSTQLSYINDHQGNKIVLMGVPNLENNNIIVLVYYPDISDSIKHQIDLLNDPSKWDYLLYLETTKSGQLINQLIPGLGENLLNLKIDLLKISLGNRAILLEVPQEDLISTVEIIHHISLRENLHILKLKTHTHTDVAIKLFGINPIFDNLNGQTHKPLLQKLDGNGTLFIENIHFLDLETQEHLANYIKQGFFHILKSDQKVSSNVRIICSTNLNLKTLIQEGKFSKHLYEELKNSLIMPSLFNLPNQELQNLIQGYSEQAIQSNAFKNLLELTDKEKINIINKHPSSLQEFKTKIHQILIEKSKKNNVEQETHFDPAYKIIDPKLIEAARLGKHALKDPKTLALLWNKFKNQNKIATFLGVNRSSVHRRFKEYKIE